MSKFFVGMEGVTTKDGRAVRIICVDAPYGYPIIGLIDGIHTPQCWDENGRGGFSDFDLILPKRTITHTIYVNVYKGSTSSYNDEHIARKVALSTCLAVAMPITVSVEVEG
jgi:hypothetical protein